MKTGLRVLLIGSLALNLLIVGVIGGGMLAGRGAGPFGGFDVSLGPFGEALSREDRRAIAFELRQRENLRLPNRRTREATLRHFLAALQAEPFDPAAIQAIFDEQRVRATGGMQAGQEIILQRLTALTPAERAEFARRLDENMKRARR